MHFFESEVEKYRRRLEKIRANPNPTKLKSNLLLYELALEEAEYRLKWYQEGRPFACCDGGPRRVVRALGMEVISTTSSGDRLGANAGPALELGRRFRYHESLCDRVLAGLGLVLGNNLVQPRFIAACNYPCTPHTLAMMSLAAHLKVPAFAIDMSHEYTADTITYLADQLEEMVKFAEARVPGARYNEEDLERENREQHKADLLLGQIQALKAHIPSPVSGTDVVRLPQFQMHNPAKSLAYLETYLEEMHDRIAKGIFPVPNERVRLMWTISAPLFTENVWNFLHSRGASVVCYEVGGEATGDSLLEQTDFPSAEKLLGRPTTPLEEAAADLARGVWNGPVERRMNLAFSLCRRYHLDGVVHFQQSGCPEGQSTAQIMAERIEAELGLPSLLLDGRSLDQEWYNETQVFSQLDEFVEQCAAYKEMRQSKVEA